ncbi:hypothetical protein F2Q70_00007282 [Brassica cretica]|uniref:Uncharacterized protein n=2 Tax=Brassica cretica TaxID=69181 RepID=A0A8S9M9S8_BRACR|nr:hypothetical protein F2Q68_00000342 [Brassica cretica]KAF2613956.1 hypothetical protein F2Q70_00007282 [Brassica cretica]KAF3551880.1 hypothetical protein DY000_02000455 [Brassica cretica]
MDITNKTLIAYVFTILFVTSHVHCGTSASPPTHCATATATSPSPPGKISLDGEDLFFFFAYVTVFAQPAMDDNNSVYVEGLPYDITDEALPYADKERVYENSHGFERRGDDVLDRNGYKERVFGGEKEGDWRGESGPIKNIKK